MQCKKNFFDEIDVTKYLPKEAFLIILNKGFGITKDLFFFKSLT